VLSLKTVGLQVKVNEALKITSQTRTLLVYTSPSVTYSPSTADVSTLTSFVASGGSLIFMNQVPTALRSLAGVSASTVDTTYKRSLLQLSNAADASASALQGFDFSNYYDISMPIFENYTAKGLINVGYTPTNGSIALGNWIVRNNGVDSADTSATHTAFVRNQPSGAKGLVYRTLDTSTSVHSTRAAVTLRTTMATITLDMISEPASSRIFTLLALTMSAFGPFPTTKAWPSLPPGILIPMYLTLTAKVWLLLPWSEAPMAI
jgi:hypothetical protein